MKKALETDSEGSGDEQAMDNDQEDVEQDEDLQEGSSKIQKPIKKRKHGIIYISSIPKFMTVSILREFLSEYAPVGRIYLQASNNQAKSDDGETTKKKKRKLKYKTFTEGWVEFLSKKAAKILALQLNGKPITTRKKSKFCDILWNIKYLPRFKWLHLSERLTYEKMVYKQRMRNEISQARKEANFFGANLDRSEFKKKKEKKKKPEAMEN